MHNWVIKEEYARLQQVIFKVPLENPFLTTFIGFNVPIVFQIPWGEQKNRQWFPFLVWGLPSSSFILPPDLFFKTYLFSCAPLLQKAPLVVVHFHRLRKG